MKVLSNAEQNKLIGAIESAIQHTHNGMSPNEAIEKVAREHKYTAPFIDRMVQGFNKAKAVHVMKEANHLTRHEPFSIADTATVVSNIYTPVEKTASINFELPANLSKVAVPAAAVEKTASIAETISHIKDPELSAASYTRALQQHADFFSNLEKVASSEMAYHRGKWQEAIETICRECSYMSQKQFEKTASQACNIYPAIGDKLMRLVAHRTSRTLSEGTLQKTASGCLPQACEPYYSMKSAYDHARLLANAEQWHKQVQKEAAVAIDALKGFTLGSMVGREDKKEDSPKDVNDLLSPEYFNRIKALDAKRALYDIMLNDDKFKPYDSAKIVGAWNAIAKSHPNLVMKNPAAASALMLQQLETGGRRDIHEIEQAQKIDKTLREEQ